MTTSRMPSGVRSGRILSADTDDTDGMETVGTEAAGTD
ncbi:hypothetical protein ABIE67_008237 [Streptomyces sp. V4I8]